MTTATTTVLIAALMGLSGAAYASGASESTESPLRAGEASTMTKGAPNLMTTNSTAGDREHDSGRSANKALTASETSDTPLRAGEATTMTGGAPNVSTNNGVAVVDPASMTTVSTTALGAGSVHVPTVEVQAP